MENDDYSVQDKSELSQNSSNLIEKEIILPVS